MPSDQQRISEQWSSAVADQRVFESIYRIYTPTHVLRQVKVRAQPIVSNHNAIIGWLGELREVVEA